VTIRTRSAVPSQSFKSSIQEAEEAAHDGITRFTTAEARRRESIPWITGRSMHGDRSDEEHGGGKQQTFGHGDPFDNVLRDV
jgi:hypothetical protein